MRRGLARIVLAAGLTCAAAPVRTAHAGQVVTPGRLVDVGFGFTLEVPAGWRVLAEDEGDPAWRGARAATLDRVSRLVGAVYVEREATTVVRAVEGRSAALRASEWTVSPPRAVRIGERAGSEVDAASESGHYRERIFRRGPDLVILRVRAPGPFPAFGEAAERFFTMVSFGPDAGPGRSRAPNFDDAQGLGWTLRDGRFVSATGRWRLDRGVGWMAFGGGRHADGAGVELVSLGGPFRRVLLRSSPRIWAEERTSKWLRAREVARGGPFLEGESESRIGPTPLRIRRHHRAEWELRHGIAFGAEVAIEVWGFCESRDEGFPTALSDLLSRFAWLGDAEATAALRSAEERGRRDVRYGPDWSIRDGTYRNHRVGVSWRGATSAWAVGLYPGAPTHPDLFNLTSLHPPCTFQVQLHPAGAAPPDAASLGEGGDVDAAAPLPSVRRKDRKIGIAAMKPVDGGRTYFALVHDEGRTLGCMLEAPDDASGLSTASTLLDGLSVRDELPAVERTPLARTHHQAGFSVSLPMGAGWAFDDEDEQPTPDVRVVARRGDHWLVAMASPLEHGAPATSRLVGWCEMSLPIGDFAPMALPRETPWTLGGRTAAHFAWRSGEEELHALVVTESHTAFAFVALVPRGTARASLEKLGSWFSFLD